MEVLGAIVLNGNSTQTVSAQPPEQAKAEDRDRMSIEEARQMFLSHVATHSPDKPETHRRYAQAVRHFERLVGHRRWVEAITRADLDEYKTKRKTEKSERTGRPITAQTINFELGTIPRGSPQNRP